MVDPNKIVFFDTTLRDGEQSPGCTMHHDEKLRMAHQLAALGVDILEAGFAIASQGDFESVRAIASEIRGPRIASLARCSRHARTAAQLMPSFQSVLRPPNASFMRCRPFSWAGPGLTGHGPGRTG